MKVPGALQTMVIGIVYTASAVVAVETVTAVARAVVVKVPRARPDPGGVAANPASNAVIVADPPLKSNFNPSAAVESLP